MIHPNYHGGRVTLGRIYFEKGELGKAEQELSKITKYLPDNLLTYQLLGKIYLHNKELDQALEVFERICVLNPGDEKAGQTLQELRSRVGVVKEG